MEKCNKVRDWGWGWEGGLKAVDRFKGVSKERGWKGHDLKRGHPERQPKTS